MFASGWSVMNTGEHLEAPAVGVGEGQLGTRVGAFAAADRPRARWPPGRGQVQAGQFGDLRAVAVVAVGVGCGLPGVGRQGQDRGGHALVQVEPDREPDPTLAQVIKERVGGTGRVGADQERTRIGWVWRASRGSWASARSSTWMWSAAVLAPALPGRGLPAGAS